MNHRKETSGHHRQNKLCAVEKNRRKLSPEAVTLGVDRAEWEISQLEGRLRETENYLDSILQASGECVIVTDTTHNIIRMNAALVDTVGYGIEDLLGQPFDTLIPLAPGIYTSTTGDVIEIGAEFIALYKGTQSRLMQEGRSQCELYLLHRCGKIIPVEMSTTLLRDERGKRIGTVSVGRDISERKKMYEVLKREKDKAEEATRYKSEFLANMSHEIRTPMNAVIGFTSMLQETTLDSEQAEYVQTIRQSGQALLALINDILDFSKIEAGKMELEEIDFDIEELAYNVCDLIKPKVAEKDIEVLCSLGENKPCQVKGDATKFRQVLINLLDNAVKFTHQGEVELSLQQEQETKDHVNLHVRVRDTGIGIPPEKLKSIFTMFQQADGSTTREFGGTGLGLSICTGIARAMRGDVWAENLIRPGVVPSEAGVKYKIAGNEADCCATPGPQPKVAGPGSVFHFIAWLKKSGKRPPAPVNRTLLSGKKVLIIDDNHRNLAITGQLLQAAGMRVETLAEPDRAERAVLDAFKAADPFDVCLVDIHMPAVSGYDVMRALRRHQVLKALPIVAFSSAALESIRKCQQEGFSGFIQKPIRRQKLLEMVENLLHEQAGQPSERSACQTTAGRAGAERIKIMENHSSLRGARQPARILLAEDNAVNQKLALMMLTKAGYQVETANNGREALEMYKKSREMNGPHRIEEGMSKVSPGERGPFNLILMDIQMPEMDGFTATQQIRKWEGERGYRIPIIAMTANVMGGDRERCLQAGMDDYIPKPITKDLVFEIVAKWKDACR